MPRLVPRHPLWVRVTHWVNVVTLGIMAYSGLLIYWANDAYGFGLFGYDIHFFPKWFYEQLDLSGGLAVGMAWHFAFAWLFALNGMIFVGYLLISGAWRDLVPDRTSPKHALQTVLHDLRIRKEPPPPAKLNGAQRFAYTGVIIMAFLMVVSGLAIYKPAQLSWLTALFGGYETARLIHFTITILFGLFLVVHVGQVLKAGWGNFRAMVTGYEVHADGN